MNQKKNQNQLILITQYLPQDYIKQLIYPNYTKHLFDNKSLNNKKLILTHPNLIKILKY